MNRLIMPIWGESNRIQATVSKMPGTIKSTITRLEIAPRSGVFVRSPKEAGGYEVQIWRQQPAGYNTGSIVGTAKTAKDFAIKPDQWNHFQITAEGDHIVVVLNGETTLDIRDAKFPEGHIRLQYQQFPIEFRNIKIRPLP